MEPTIIVMPMTMSSQTVSLMRVNSRMSQPSGLTRDRRFFSVVPFMVTSR